MGWQRELPEAVESRKPIILDLAFNPGWSVLSKQFEGKSSLGKTPKYVNDCLDSASHRFKFRSAYELLIIAEKIMELDPDALNRTYIHFENDVRRFDDFVVGRDPLKTIHLQGSFHMAQQFVSKLDKDERAQFLESKNREKRASTFPRLFFFIPSQDTREGKKGENGLLLGSHVAEAFKGTVEEGEFVGLQAIQVRDTDLRKILCQSNVTAIIANPYVHYEDFQSRLEEALIENAPETKYGLIHMAVTNKSQISTFVPENFVQD